MIRQNVICFILLLLTATGCGMQKKMKNSDFLQHEEVIAKFTDLPDTPFQVQLQQVAVSQKAREELQLFYTFSMSVQDLIAFYHQQMERLGWELIVESNIQNCLMHFVKPTQFCSVLITENDLSIYVGCKKGA